MNYYNYIVRKKFLNNIPHRKLSLNCKQHSKKRRQHVLIKFKDVGRGRGVPTYILFPEIRKKKFLLSRNKVHFLFDIKNRKQKFLKLRNK